MSKKLLISILLLILSQITYVHAETFTFSDVFPDDKNLNTALNTLVPEGVIKGYSDNTFKPLNFVNRAEFTKMIITAKKIDVLNKTYEECFDDVKLTEWYAPYVCEAYLQGWIKGFNDGFFHPEENLSLSESLSILSKAFKWTLKDAKKITQMPYQDILSADWFLPHMEFAKRNLILQELSVFISPNRILDRKKSAEYIYRTLMISQGQKLNWDKIGTANQTYQEVLSTGVKPAIPPTFDFPHKSQSGYSYACYGFSVINLTNYKYNLNLNIEDLATNIGWDKYGIWTDEESNNFAKYYDTDVIFGYYTSPAYVFEKLADGEPLVIYRQYYIDGKNVGHQAVAFSFDELGIYFGDSANGKVTRIPYEEIFLAEWDNKAYNAYEYRLLKADGSEKIQMDL
jgi:hypothetical protein